MGIYEGSPRQDYEEVLRSIGAFQMVDAGAGWRADRPTGAAQPKPSVPPRSG